MGIIFITHMLGTYAACGFQVTIQRKQMQFVVQVKLSFWVKSIGFYALSIKLNMYKRPDIIA